jgi:hypothetical protein
MGERVKSPSGSQFLVEFLTQPAHEPHRRFEDRLG